MATEQSLRRTFPGRTFGRKGMATALPAPRRSMPADDLRLFVLTFAGGFLFMTVFLA